MIKVQDKDTILLLILAGWPGESGSDNNGSDDMPALKMEKVRLLEKAVHDGKVRL